MIVYTVPNCVQCRATKTKADQLGLKYRVVDASVDAEAAEHLRRLGYQAAPVVQLDNGEHWYGYSPDRLKRWADEQLSHRVP